MPGVPYRFFAVTFAWSWIVWAPLVLAPWLGLSPEVVTKCVVPLTIVGAFGPLVGALASVRSGGPGSTKKFLLRFVDVRLGATAWLVPPLVLGVTNAIAWLVPMAFGESFLPMLLPSVWVFPPYLLLMILIGGGQEEFGWRGYALERMEASLGRWLGNIVLGLIWAAWHVPLWFIPNTSQSYMSFAGFVLLTQGYSFFLSWVYQASGRRPLSALWAHGLANAIVPMMPVLRLEPGAAQPRYWIWVALTFATGLVFMTMREPGVDD